MKQLAAGAAAAALGMVLVFAVGTAAIGGTSSESVSGGGGGNGQGLKGDAPVPASYLPWIKKAADLCPEDESPSLIAAQLWAESGFQDRDGPPTASGTAKGPAQFIDSTWVTYGRDDDGSGTASPHDVGDAVMALGRYMCSLFGQAKASSYPGGADALALAGYNAGWGAVQKYNGVPPYRETSDYVAKIQAKAAEWRVLAEAPPPVTGSGAGADAVRKATAYLGLPYVWGGGSPAGPSVGFCDDKNGWLNGTCFASSHSGFDCSSLVQASWWQSVKLPRTAGDQYTATASRPVPMGSLAPGDLIFYSHSGSGADSYHVVMYYGDGKVIEAPKTGKQVQIVPLYTTGGLVGATRPA
ncbi:NlpC/P60 family protein [Kitasatospora sp. NPDC127116]|uniref:C40 family peptidase n=1 Tax=Kitasatospora sp. NPDC127116 TaxID=3345367 RepID=UPI0036428CC6